MEKFTTDRTKNIDTIWKEISNKNSRMKNHLKKSHYHADMLSVEEARQRIISKFHILDKEYYKRIEAVQFTITHDDGKIINDLDKSDVILVGISRTSKTPTSIYLANRGYKVANIPIIPNKNLPKELITKSKNFFVVGLICDAIRLSDVRRNRVQSMHEDRPGNYTNEKEIINELENSKKLFKKNNWPIIDVTRKSVEETAASIIKIFDILHSKWKIKLFLHQKVEYEKKS